MKAYLIKPKSSVESFQPVSLVESCEPTVITGRTNWEVQRSQRSPVFLQLLRHFLVGTPSLSKDRLCVCIIISIHERHIACMRPDFTSNTGISAHCTGIKVLCVPISVINQCFRCKQVWELSLETGWNQTQAAFPTAVSTLSQRIPRNSQSMFPPLAFFSFIFVHDSSSLFSFSIQDKQTTFLLGTCGS